MGNNPSGSAKPLALIASRYCSILAILSTLIWNPRNVPHCLSFLSDSSLVRSCDPIGQRFCASYPNEPDRRGGGGSGWPLIENCTEWLSIASAVGGETANVLLPLLSSPSFSLFLSPPVSARLKSPSWRNFRCLLGASPGL